MIMKGFIEVIRRFMRVHVGIREEGPREVMKGRGVIRDDDYSFIAAGSGRDKLHRALKKVGPRSLNR